MLKVGIAIMAFGCLLSLVGVLGQLAGPILRDRRELAECRQRCGTCVVRASGVHHLGAPRHHEARP